METMVKNDLNQLMQQREDGPYIAIYLNTAVVLNDLNRRRLQFKQLVNEAETQMAHHFPKTEFAPYATQLEQSSLTVVTYTFSTYNIPLTTMSASIACQLFAQY